MLWHPALLPQFLAATRVNPRSSVSGNFCEDFHPHVDIFQRDGSAEIIRIISMMQQGGGGGGGRGQTVALINMQMSLPGYLFVLIVLSHFAWLQILIHGHISITVTNCCNYPDEAQE